MNYNFDLLPAIKPGASITPIVVRLFGLFLLWYAYSLLRGYGNELLWIGRLLGLR